MELRDAFSTVVIYPARYEFIPRPPHDEDYAVIHGEIKTPLMEWTFDDPCLRPGDSRALAVWLEDVVVGQATVVEDEDIERGEVPEASFIEPELAFSLAAWSEQEAQIRVHISELALPLAVRRIRPIFEFWVPVTMSLDDISDAAEVWEQEISMFPPRH